MEINDVEWTSTAKNVVYNLKNKWTFSFKCVIVKKEMEMRNMVKILLGCAFITVALSLLYVAVLTSFSAFYISGAIILAFGALLICLEVFKKDKKD